MKNFKTKAGTELPIRDLRGKDYLDVKYRLVWFREEKPDWSIQTALHEVDKDSCVASALIKDPQGRVVQTAHKYEDKEGFADFREKAETGAVGRALAMLGYGTQFVVDFDEGARLVDAPIDQPPPPAIGSPVKPKTNSPEEEYRVPFGKKYKGLTLDEIGPEGCRGYVTYLEESAAKDRKPLSPLAQDFVNRASHYVVQHENPPQEERDIPF